MSRIEEEFVEFDKNRQWQYIYGKIKQDSAMQYRECSIKDAKSPGNKARNRYRDVSPYDHSRVRLRKNSLDYINASLVKVPVAERSYILTQGPLASTSGHFWLMVWEQNSRAVLMLNRVIEKGQLKCHKYYPDEEAGDITYDDVGIKVTYLSEEDCDHFSIRTLQLTDVESGEEKEVLQFHYTTWPDFGVPHSPEAFLKFLMAVRDSGSLDADVGPPVIHCSAGIGRSGTFCLVDSALVLIARDMSMDDIDIREMLLDMRQFRMGLIQTHDQLRFSYLAIIEAGRDIVGESIESTFKTPMNRIAPPKPPRLQREYGVDDSIVTTNTNDLTDAINSAVNDINDTDRSKEKSIEENGDDTPPPPLPPRKRSHNNAVDPAFGNSKAGASQEEPMDQSTEKRRKEQTEVRRRNREDRLRHTAEQVDKMKRKQQQSEKWRRRRSLVKPVTILGVAISACLVGYIIYNYYYSST